MLPGAATAGFPGERTDVSTADAGGGTGGRGDIEGEVVVQSFTPFHPAIQHARRHDFAGFYEQEIAFREQLKYPAADTRGAADVKGLKTRTR